MWLRLRQNKWQHRPGRGLDGYAYLPPGGFMDGEPNCDWFQNETEAHHFACR